jgi:phospholipase/carboxylesterase
MALDANGDITPFSRKLDYLCSELVRSLRAIEHLQRRFFPPAMPSLQEEILPLLPSLDQARRDTRKIEPLRGFEGVRDALDRSAGLVAEALELITTSSRSDMEKAVMQVLQGLRKCCRAQEQLFPLRRALPAIDRFFLEPEVRDRASGLDPDPPPRADSGLHHVGTDREPYARGSYSLYVPESYDGSQPWPLVTALHGGFGHGRDFLWTWLREARSRRFLLLAPTSSGTTWSLLMPEIDGEAIAAMIDEIRGKWKVDSRRMLLTGISDGGTFALGNALQPESPFTAYAVVACVMPPGDLEPAARKRIYWIHGALDWMFRLEIAQRDAKVLERFGAHITLRVIHDLSHTYPRDENGAMLTWFDPSLSLSAPM